MESADEARFKSIIADSIILLCNKGMLSKSVSKVEGLLGITLEDQRVILINVNEVFATHISTPSSQVKRPRSTAHSATVATPPEPAVKKRKVQLHARREVVKPVFEHKNPVSPCEELPIEDWPPVEQPDLCGEMDHVAQPVKLFQNTNVVKLKEEASVHFLQQTRPMNSAVWQFFRRPTKCTVQCNLCNAVLRTANGSTTCMWSHIKRCVKRYPQFKSDIQQAVNSMKVAQKSIAAWKTEIMLLPALVKLENAAEAPKPPGTGFPDLQDTEDQDTGHESTGDTGHEINIDLDELYGQQKGQMEGEDGTLQLHSDVSPHDSNPLSPTNCSPKESLMNESWDNS